MGGPPSPLPPPTLPGSNSLCLVGQKVQLCFALEEEEGPILRSPRGGRPVLGVTMAGVVPELQKQERQARHQRCLALIEGLGSQLGKEANKTDRQQGQHSASRSCNPEVARGDPPGLGHLPAKETDPSRQAVLVASAADRHGEGEPASISALPHSEDPKDA